MRTLTRSGFRGASSSTLRRASSGVAAVITGPATWSRARSRGASSRARKPASESPPRLNTVVTPYRA
jgi:hypothetical protein